MVRNHMHYIILIVLVRKWYENDTKSQVRNRYETGTKQVRNRYYTNKYVKYENGTKSHALHVYN
jgi:hypothetical protein